MIDFKSLRVWEAFHKITLKIYSLTSGFPSYENYGLISQMRRSSASIPTNIAEGCGRHSDAELHKFSVIAMGSASELEYQLLLAKDLGYLSLEEYNTILEELTISKKMLNTFIKKIRNRIEESHA